MAIFSRVWEMPGIASTGPASALAGGLRALIAVLQRWLRLEFNVPAGAGPPGRLPAAKRPIASRLSGPPAMYSQRMPTGIGIDSWRMSIAESLGLRRRLFLAVGWLMVVATGWANWYFRYLPLHHGTKSVGPHSGLWSVVPVIVCTPILVMLFRSSRCPFCKKGISGWNLDAHGEALPGCQHCGANFRQRAA